MSYIDKLRNMAVEADLADATAENLIVVVGIIWCRKEELWGDLYELQDVMPKQPKKQDQARRKKIERLMKGTCYRCGERHQAD